MCNRLEEMFKDVYKKNGNDLQSTIIILKSAGFTQIDIIKLLIKEFNISLNEADDILLNSKAWENEKNNILKLRDDFGDELLK